MKYECVCVNTRCCGNSCKPSTCPHYREWLIERHGRREMRPGDRCYYSPLKSNRHDFSGINKRCIFCGNSKAQINRALEQRKIKYGLKSSIMSKSLKSDVYDRK